MIEDSTRKAGVFVDRDGTLIKEVGYLRRLEQIEVLPRVPEAIQLLREQGLKVAVVTNQSAVARGFITEDMLRQIHQELKMQLARRGAYLDGIYYCPHHPTEGMDSYRIPCDCRKPNVGMARRAAADLNLDFSRSYVVGDQSRDMELATRIGAKGILISSGNGVGSEQVPTSGLLAVRDLWEAAQWVIQDLHSRKR